MSRVVIHRVLVHALRVVLDRGPVPEAVPDRGVLVIDLEALRTDLVAEAADLVEEIVAQALVMIAEQSPSKTDRTTKSPTEIDQKPRMIDAKIVDQEVRTVTDQSTI